MALLLYPPLVAPPVQQCVAAQHSPDAETRPNPTRPTYWVPKCTICADQVHCTQCDHFKGPSAACPECFRPLLGTSLDRVTALVAWWNAFHGCGGDRRLDAVQRALLARLETDRWRFSEVFEPSCSFDRKGWHFWRFSYAFPDLDSDPAAMIHDLLEVCRPFGDDLRSLVRTLLCPVREKSVRQPLVGLAYDSPVSWRVKFYLQFRDDAGDEPLGIAARLTGRTDLSRLFHKRSLHLVGIDLGPRGIVGAKLHFREPHLPCADVPRVAGPVELIDYLANSGMSHIHDLLVIHRMKRRDDPGLEHAAEVDFGLLENGLFWKDLAGSTTLRRVRPGNDPLGALESAFPMAVRRVSVSVGRPEKLTLYYVPTELDAESVDS